MRLRAATVGLIAAFSANCAQAQDFHWFWFSKSERKITGHDYEVGVDQVRRDGRDVLIARLVIDPTNRRSQETKWTDSDHCPAMAPALSKLQSIEPFKIVPPGVRGGAGAVTLDGDTYELHAHGYWPLTDRNGDISLSSNAGPLVNWVDDTLKALAPCWGKQRPFD